jgi:hypothetical protein
MHSALRTLSLLAVGAAAIGCAAERRGDPYLMALPACTAAPSPADPLPVRGACVHDGRVHGRWNVQRADGSRLSEGTWRDGRRQGMFAYYDATGRLRAQVRYADDVRQGETVLFHEDGQRRFRVFYEQGRPVGTSTAWTAAGGRIAEVDYDAAISPRVRTWLGGKARLSGSTGGMARRQAADGRAPKACDAEEMARVAPPVRERLLRCHAERLHRGAKTGGPIAARFEIGLAGTVDPGTVTIDGAAAEALGACLRAEVLQIAVPPPPRRCVGRLTYDLPADLP